MLSCLVHCTFYTIDASYVRQDPKRVMDVQTEKEEQNRDGVDMASSDYKI